MKKLFLILILVAIVIAVILEAYQSGRNDVWVLEYKKCQSDMIDLTYWQTNQPPELKELVKAHYYFLSNRIPTNWADPKDYGPVSTNIGNLGAFKGPTSAQIEYTNFLKRYGLMQK
jgi:hypothetical protein